MFFPFGQSHQQNTRPLQQYVKGAGAGQTPNPFSSMLNPNTPTRNRRKRKGKGNRRRDDVKAPGTPAQKMPDVTAPGEPGQELGGDMNPFNPRMLRKMMKQSKKRGSFMPLDPVFMSLLAKMMGGSRRG